MRKHNKTYCAGGKIRIEPSDRTTLAGVVAGVAARGGGIGGAGGWVIRWQEASGEGQAPAPKEREDIPEE